MELQREETPPVMHDVRCDITGLRDSTCRYPLWNAPGEEHFYCGVPEAQNSAGKPYCKHHAKLCFRPAFVSVRNFSQQRRTTVQPPLALLGR